MGTCSVGRADFSLERQEEELNTSKTCFVYSGSRPVCPHLDFITSSPRPQPPLSERALPRKQGSPRLPPH